MSFEKSVKGATKLKVRLYRTSLHPRLPNSPTDSRRPQNAPPKTKYIEHILIATHSGEAGVAEIFRAMQNRLRDSTWTVVFKSLITVHLMIREGAPNVTLAYLSKNSSMLAISGFTDGALSGLAGQSWHHRC